MPGTSTTTRSGCGAATIATTGASAHAAGGGASTAHRPSGRASSSEGAGAGGARGVGVVGSFLLDEIQRTHGAVAKGDQLATLLDEVRRLVASPPFRLTAYEMLDAAVIDSISLACPALRTVRLGESDGDRQRGEGMHARTHAHTHARPHARMHARTHAYA